MVIMKVIIARSSLSSFHSCLKRPLRCKGEKHDVDKNPTFDSLVGFMKELKFYFLCTQKITKACLNQFCLNIGMYLLTLTHLTICRTTCRWCRWQRKGMTLHLASRHVRLIYLIPFVGKRSQHHSPLVSCSRLCVGSPLMRDHSEIITAIILLYLLLSFLIISS